MSLKVYVGCMFSGKTTELIREYKKWTNIGKNVLLINYASDERYGADDFVYSHDKNKVPCIKAMKLNELEDDLFNNVDVILINEGQFFNDIVEFCNKWVDQKNKDIVVCGLDGDFQRKPFGKMADIIALADKTIKLTAFCSICKDGTPGIFTKRLTCEKELIVIGSDNYIPVCRKHYNNYLQ